MGKKFKIGVSSVLLVLQCVALAFLILACLSAPVSPGISLAKLDEVRYGVFGYCDSGDSCITARANYHPEEIQSDGDWKMGQDARRALGSILIVTPVAAGLTFVSLVIGCMCQFSPFNSSVVAFVFNLFFSLVAFLSSALVCIAVLLLFFPNVTWYAYMLIVSAALNLISLPLCFLVRSQTASEKNDDYDDQDHSSSSIRDQFYKQELNATDLTNYDDPSLSYPDYYKGTKIITSHTLNSNTITDSDVPSFQAKNITAAPLPTLPGSQSEGFGLVTAPYQRDSTRNDTSFLHNSVPRQPYSAINNNGTTSNVTSSSQAVPTGRILAPNNSNYKNSNNIQNGVNNVDNESRPVLDRNNSLQPSSVYTERMLDNEANVTTLAPQGHNNIRDAKTVDPLDLPPKSQQDVLQDIINGVLTEDEEEFLRQNTVDPSERPVVESFDDDDDGIKDDDSQFTSVSQRGINPRYYQAGRDNSQQANMQYYPPLQEHQNLAPVQGSNNIMPGQPSMNMNIGGQFYPPLPNQAGLPVQGYPVGQPMDMQMQQQPFQQRPPYSAGPSASDFLLQSNPEFSVGGGPASSGNNQRSAGLASAPLSSSMHYKPAYKKRLPRKNIVPPASMSRDSPYGGF